MASARGGGASCMVLLGRVATWSNAQTPIAEWGQRQYSSCKCILRIVSIVSSSETQQERNTSRAEEVGRKRSWVCGAFHLAVASLTIRSSSSRSGSSSSSGSSSGSGSGSGGSSSSSSSSSIIMLMLFHGYIL